MAAYLGLAHDPLFGYVDVQPIKDNGTVSKIMSEMKLPNERTDKGADSHYRCSACLLVREGE